MEPKVSVVMPVYGVERYLRECLDSVIAQTYQNIEIIAVDDGSKDKSGIILDEYEKRDSRVIVIHKTNEGVSAARNDGIKKATGDYLYIMDSDDVLEINAIQVMVENAEKMQVDVLITDHVQFFENGELKETKLFPEMFCTEDPETIRMLICMVLYNSYSPFPSNDEKGLGIAPPWTKLLKTRLVQDNHLLFDSDVRGIFDDGLFAMMVFLNAARVGYIPQMTYRYRVLQNSLMRGYNPNRIDINNKVFEKIDLFQSQNHIAAPFDNAYQARIIKYLRYVFRAYLFSSQYPKSNRERKSEFDAVMNKTKYQTAIRKVEIDKLTKAEKMIVLLARYHMKNVIYHYFASRLTK